VSGETIIEGGGLRVIFARVGDRFAHTIGRLAPSTSDLRLPISDVRSPTSDARFVPLLESVEGTAGDDWPASPPLQSMHLEGRPDGKRLALLVGMAGRSHWSLSLELDPTGGKVMCDIACRLHAEPAALTSTYRIAEAKLLLASDSALRLSSVDREYELRVEAIAGDSCTLRLAGLSEITIHCASPRAPLPCTARWRYTLQRTSAEAQWR